MLPGRIRPRFAERAHAALPSSRPTSETLGDSGTRTRIRTHSKDSSDLAFQSAAADAVVAALAQAGTTLLEPVMDLVVETPSAHVGDVIGDVQRRSGRVLAIESRAQVGEGAEAVVLAQAPLAQLQGYATALRSLTQGRASAQMSFTAYAPVK